MKEEQKIKCNELGIEIITSIEAVNIIETREPIGRFILKEEDLFIGIDNLSGDAWVEEFEKFDNCISWLCGDEIDEEECLRCGTDYEDLYRYDNKVYCADCLLELLEEHGEIESFSMGKTYKRDGEYIGNDQDDGIDSILNSLSRNLDIEKVGEGE